MEKEVFESPMPLNQDKQPSFEINVGGSRLSEISSITASPSLKRISLASTFPKDFEQTNDTQEEERNIIKAMEEIEERQKEIENSRKLLLDVAKKILI